jgi:hypothetical protein
VPGPAALLQVILLLSPLRVLMAPLTHITPHASTGPTASPTTTATHPSTWRAFPAYPTTLNTRLSSFCWTRALHKSTHGTARARCAPPTKAWQFLSLQTAGERPGAPSE